MKEYTELQQLASDCAAITKALKTEIADMAQNPGHRQSYAVRAMEDYLISRTPFLGLSNGQQTYLDNYLELVERISYDH